jgi:outer membrane receptor protein involved in Fe transport
LNLGEKKEISLFGKGRGFAALSPLAAVISSLLLIPHEVLGQPSQIQQVTVTGTRILKADFESASPILTISGDELRANPQVTLETFLNTLPQINPAATITSNNPGNAGQASIDLRGLGQQRNLVLVDGRRPMVSASDQTVDLNTIPLALIESVEIITGGASAVYGSDAIAGVINIKTRRDFQGIDLRYNWSNQQRTKDALEKSVQGTVGGNFAGNRGNAVLSFEIAEREPLTKSQRPFSLLATSTTSSWPEGRVAPQAGNPHSQAAVDSLMMKYNYPLSAPKIPASSAFTFNNDGTLIYPGLFNNRLDVFNWKHPIDNGVNTRFFPDFYSYNFDPVNLLVLPFDRKAVSAKADYRFESGVEVFSRFSYTQYTAATALAPTPTGVTTQRATDFSGATSRTLVNPLLESGKQSSGLIVPVTNPFVPADLKALLDSRIGDNVNLKGVGASEPFVASWRALALGLRQSANENTVMQYLAGARGPILDSGWSWEGYASHGTTTIRTTSTGNADANKMRDMLLSADGGKSLCEGGLNIFGRQKLSQACVDFLSVRASQSIEFSQGVRQFFVSGDLGKTAAGPIATIAGIEHRSFSYSNDPGSLNTPVYGFNTTAPVSGENSFHDIFAEADVPVFKGLPLAERFSLGVAARAMQSRSSDLANNIDSGSSRSNAASVTANWQLSGDFKIRSSLQRSVRAPNFGELFSGGGSFPQIFDPCSSVSAKRSGTDASKVADLCRQTGVVDPATFVPSPGAQAFQEISGNTLLQSERGNTFTVGFVWTPKSSPWRATADFYRIQVRDAIQTADVNEVIADCYNYSGRNPTYVLTDSCKKIFRQGSSITDLLGPSVDDTWKYENAGRISTSGLDASVGWGGTVGTGRLTTQLFWNHLLEFKSQGDPSFPAVDYSGTVPYFGAGFGQAFPRNRISLVNTFAHGRSNATVRYRLIGAMENRASVVYPGEAFTGVPAVSYVDASFSHEIVKGLTLRAGLNNLFDKKPPQYSPNVQSGTDPSTYDVIGRRIFVQAVYRYQ